MNPAIVLEYTISARYDDSMSEEKEEAGLLSEGALISIGNAVAAIGHALDILEQGGVHGELVDELAMVSERFQRVLNQQER